MGQVKGCHLVGSVCLPDADAVLRQCSAGMPRRLKRIPDGETGERQLFTFWQLGFFNGAPEMLLQFKNNEVLPSRSHSPEQVSAGIDKLKRSNPRTRYDEVAIESYKTFVKLRDEGVIDKGTRFQVSLPTYANVIIVVEDDFKVEASQIYEEALFRAMRHIQDVIPHEDLAIQIDLAADTVFWEDLALYRPWFHQERSEFEQRKQYIVNYIVRMISHVDQDVEVGIHNCYGDMGNVHWKEPESLAVITERALALFERTPHPINFFHLPVPISAMGKLEAYFKPLLPLLPKLKEHGTDLYLGLVHAYDLEGTRKRIEAAKAALGDIDFGVATECGWGRTPPEKIQSILDISKEVSEEVVS